MEENPRQRRKAIGRRQEVPPPQQDEEVLEEQVQGRGRGMAVDRSRMAQMGSATNAIALVRDGTKLEDRVRGAQEIQRMLQDQGTDGEVRQMLTEFSHGLNIPQFLSAAKAIRDIRETGRHAWEYTKSGDPESLKALQQIQRDRSRDPMARSMAEDFEKYGTAYLSFQETIKEFGDDSELTHRIDEETYIKHKKGEKDRVMRNGVEVLKVNQADDPRFIDMVAKNMETYLLPDPSGKKDKASGTVIADTNASVMMMDAQEYLVEKMKEFDRPRVTKSIETGRKEVTRMKLEAEEVRRRNLEKRQKKEEEPKKKKRGLGLFK